MPARAAGTAALRRRASGAGFTMVELLIVIAIIAVGVGLIVVTLPDGDTAKLDEEGARLTALLDTARAEARVSGTAVRWVPRAAASAGVDDGVASFVFVGLPPKVVLPTRWLDPRTTAYIAGGSSVVLGPEAILPPQRIVLRLQDRRLELASDGMGSFVVPVPKSDTAAALVRP
jgi:general secretion pathway protein H